MAARSPDLPAERGPEVEHASEVFRSRPVLTALLVVGFALIAEHVPLLEPLRVLHARAPSVERTPTRVEEDSSTGEVVLKQETRGAPELAPGALPDTPPSEVSPPVNAPPAPQSKWLELPPRSLDAFFRALAQSETKAERAITRIAYFGDSVVAGDLVTGSVRRLFQQRFGDAGHGFTLIANPWPSYFHNDIERFATSGWKVSRVVGPLAEDGFYGLGCVSFSAEKNTLARFATAKKGDFGRSAARFGVAYLASENGGSFQLSVDGRPVQLVDTRAERKESRFAELTVPDGPHEFEIMTKSGQSRLFGITLERDVAGVVLDALGVQGARIRMLDKQDDAHWAEQLAHRKPDLVVYQFGANESADGVLYPMPEYHRTMKEVVAQGQRALPQASCLLVGALDRATKNGEELMSLRIIPRLVDEQRAVANELGCAFFDTFHAMGGHGAMPSWVRRGLALSDFTHPNSIGADMIASWLFKALMERYGEFKLTESGGPSATPNARSATSSPSAR